ncbi:fatty acid synthase beta subunit dehydratase [Fusarium longipes]|uniref:Fatty acid synthase beta subunit dehydratase n=1 Tax=Fusarium longipes TaxID=694270 RepID=A0A395T277_9HYPO|nr:fatty acid synthase beta subunit dehydratase [Fusarium longipes]
MTAACNKEPTLPAVRRNTAQLLQKIPFPLLSKLHDLKAGAEYAEPSSPESPSPKDKAGYENAQSMLEVMLEYADRVTQMIMSPGAENIVAHRDLLRLLVDYIEQTILATRNIHTVVAAFPITNSEKSRLLCSYYEALHAADLSPSLQENGLFGSSTGGASTDIYTIFGGQGLRSNSLEELRELRDTYPSMARELIYDLTTLLDNLSKTDDITSQLLPQGLKVLSWLDDSAQVPDPTYLSSAPVSVPLIGLVQLVNYEIVCRTLGLTPGQLCNRIAGTTGHSQGIITAAATVAANDWFSWRESTHAALTTLFWIGIRTQQTWDSQFRINTISEAMTQDSIDHGERKPSPMLSVRGLAREELQTCIDATRRYLRDGGHDWAISMTNGPRHFVVSGPPTYLYGLNLQIRKRKKLYTQKSSADKAHAVGSTFLEVSVPFHSSWLKKAVPMIQNDLKDVWLHSSHAKIKVPVFSTENGQDINQGQGSNILHELVDLVVCRGLNWANATANLYPEHALGIRSPTVLDFGPGGVHGISSLFSPPGGPRVILAGTLGGKKTDVGYKEKLFG